LGRAKLIGMKRITANYTLRQEYERSTLQNCTVTIEVSEGIYNDSANGNVTIVDEQLIQREVFSIPNGRYETILTFMPNTTCLAQTTEDDCISESLRDANCTWCRDCETCLP
ncbi:hypothetical protein EWB00_009333, partial [Schistosoma japonicum]